MRAECWPFLASSNVRMNTAKASESIGAMRRSNRNITPARQHRALQHLTIRRRMLRVGSSTYALSESCQKKARKNGYRVTAKGLRIVEQVVSGCDAATANTSARAAHEWAEPARSGASTHSDAGALRRSVSTASA